MRVGGQQQLTEIARLLPSADVVRGEHQIPKTATHPVVRLPIEPASSRSFRAPTRTTAMQEERPQGCGREMREERDISVV